MSEDEEPGLVELRRHDDGHGFRQHQLIRKLGVEVDRRQKRGLGRVRMNLRTIERLLNKWKHCSASRTSDHRRFVVDSDPTNDSNRRGVLWLSRGLTTLKVAWVR